MTFLRFLINAAGLALLVGLTVAAGLLAGGLLFLYGIGVHG